MRRLIIFIWFFVLLFAGSQNIFGQKKNKPRLIRLEIPTGTTENFRLAPMGKNGLIIFYETNQLNAKGNRLWYYALFDVHMKQKWLRPVALPNDLFFVNQKQVGDAVYFVFKSSGKQKKDAGYYDILIYDIKREAFRNIKGNLPPKAEIAGFAIQGEKLAMGLNLNNHNADLLIVNTETGAIKVTHLTDLQQVAVDGVYSNNSAGTFVVVVSALDAKSSVRQIMYSFSPNAALVQKVDIKYSDPMSRLDDFVLADANGNNLKFFGVYHLVTKGGFLSFNNDKENPNTAGLFYLSIENGRQKDLRHFNFMNFKNIPGTFVQSRFHKVKGRIRSVFGERPGTVSLLNITRPEVFHDNNEYVVAANAYIAYYKSESRMEYDFYGNMYPTNYQVFAGYQFYDVILAGLTGDGRMIWDNDFPLENILSYKIENKALVYPDSAVITLAYVSGGQIITQDISGSKRLDSREKINIASRYGRDRPVGSGESKMVHWYAHYFLVYGYQQLKNRALQNQPLRTVFYINKVALQ
ncbi:hypothetical protein MNBD_BACTEROID07-1808 [hydrothermal vent metagenome]|uniref:Uncharacterized protein n=1 Tax=hydrothermal vent metagenome TaxID=652676 RepID=A0A3B0UD21_9ZZZZ